MKKTILATTSAAALMLAMANSASAAGNGSVDGDMNWYVSAFGGASFYHDPKIELSAGPLTYIVKPKVGFIVGGAIGVDGMLMPGMRNELEISYARVTSSKITIFGATIPLKSSYSTINILANSWYDFKNDSTLTPYLGAGLGLGIVNAKISSGAFRGSSVGFAFQAGLGVKYAMTETVDIDLGYRFRGLVGGKYQQTGLPLKRFNLFSHSVQAGVSFKF